MNKRTSNGLFTLVITVVIVILVIKLLVLLQAGFLTLLTVAFLYGILKK